MPADSSDTFRFGAFELDAGACELRRGGVPVRLERLPMDLLILLVRQRGRLVTRTEIVDAIWGQEVFIGRNRGQYSGSQDSSGPARLD